MGSELFPVHDPRTLDPTRGCCNVPRSPAMITTEVVDFYNNRHRLGQVPAVFQRVQREALRERLTPVKGERVRVPSEAEAA